jgi:hypothetical protein
MTMEVAVEDPSPGYNAGYAIGQIMVPLCCLAVVAGLAITLVVVLVKRSNRQKAAQFNPYPPQHPGQQYPGQQHPGQPPYPGQQPPYPGQQPGQPPYPGQQPPHPGQPPYPPQ